MVRKIIDHYTKYGKKYYETHKEKELERNKNYYKENKEAKLERHRHHVLKSRYGIDMSTYLRMWKQQKGECAICKQAQTKTMDVDHCHTSGKVRGLLCNNCNRGLGHFKDNIQNLKNGIKYLKKASA